MGGGTGTGAAPVVAEIARELGILSVAVVTRPFLFEGPIRGRNCAAGIAALRQYVDTIIIINNQKIRTIAGKGTTSDQAFSMADEVLVHAVRGITDIILRHGNIHVDFADVRTVMENGGDALMGTGVGSGDDRAIKAAEQAINSPLIDDIGVSGASGVLINISHGPNFTMDELDAVMTYIYEAVGEENQPNIIFGDITLPELEDQVMVTVIATGFQKDGRAAFDSYGPLSSVIAPAAPAPAPVAPATSVATSAVNAAPTPATTMSMAPNTAQPDTGSLRRVEASIPRPGSDTAHWSGMNAPIMRTAETATVAAEPETGSYLGHPRTHQQDSVLDETAWSNPYVDVRQSRPVEEESYPSLAQTVEAPQIGNAMHGYAEASRYAVPQTDRFTRDNRALTKPQAGIGGSAVDSDDSSIDYERYNIPTFLRNSEAGASPIIHNGDPRY